MGYILYYLGNRVMYSKAPIIRTEHWVVWAVHSMYCRTGISTSTYNRNFRVHCTWRTINVVTVHKHATTSGSIISVGYQLPK